MSAKDPIPMVLELSSGADCVRACRLDRRAGGARAGRGAPRGGSGGVSRKRAGRSSSGCSRPRAARCTDRSPFRAPRSRISTSGGCGTTSFASWAGKRLRTTTPSVAGADITLALYADRLEIQSPGRLPNTVSVEGMVSGLRYARNQTLVNVMRGYRYVDFQGMGVRDKIIPGMRAHNGTEPDLVAAEARFIVRLWKEKTGG